MCVRCWAGPACPAKHGRYDEQMILVDESGPDRVRGEGRTTYRDIEGRSYRTGQQRIRFGLYDPLIAVRIPIGPFQAQRHSASNLPTTTPP